MRLGHHEAPALQPAQNPESMTNTPRGLLTPARRAALEALELEFHDLLVRDILKAASR